MAAMFLDFVGGTNKIRLVRFARFEPLTVARHTVPSTPWSPPAGRDVRKFYPSRITNIIIIINAIIICEYHVENLRYCLSSSIRYFNHIHCLRNVLYFWLSFFCTINIITLELGIKVSALINKPCLKIAAFDYYCVLLPRAGAASV